MVVHPEDCASGAEDSSELGGGLALSISPGGSPLDKPFTCLAHSHPKL